MEGVQLLKFTLPLGAGLGRLRLTCGAVVGMAIVCGYIVGKNDPSDENKNKVYEAVREVVHRFEEKYTTITCKELLESKKLHPDALVISHPECEEEILNLSDYIGSTAEIIDFANKSDNNEFIICTEDGVVFKLETDNPNKKFYFTKTRPCCVDMKLNTLEKLLNVLETEENALEVDAETRKRATLPLDRMLELAR